MATFNKFQAFVGALGLGHVNLNTDTLRIYLTNATPSATADSVKADLAEIANGNGYTTGGTDIGNLFSEAGGTGTVTATGDPSWTATGGSIGPFQWAVLYDDTVATAGFVDQLIGWWAATGAITLTTGESFTVDLNTASVFTIS